MVTKGEEHLHFLFLPTCRPDFTRKSRLVGVDFLSSKVCLILEQNYTVRCEETEIQLLARKFLQ